MANLTPMRYAHSEGHIDLSYNDSGDCIITGGSDGDVRVYKGFEDDDPLSYRVGDSVFSVVSMGGMFFVGADDNAVKAMRLSDGDLDGIITRFTAPVTHIVINPATSQLAASSCDFTVKLVDLKSNKEQTLQEHNAPVLSVALHPDGKFVASSGCDGEVKIYDLEENRIIKVVDGLQKCNDFLSSAALCRLAWDTDGKFLLVPLNREIKVFTTSGWNLAFTLTDDSVKELISVIAVSPNGKYVAGGCRDGGIIIWNLMTKTCLLREVHSKNLAIVALKWNPKGNGEIAYADIEGQIGILNIESMSSTSTSKTQEHTVDLGNDLFDDGDEEVLIDAMKQESRKEIIPKRKNMSRVLEDDDDDDSRDYDLGKIKAETMGEFMDDCASETSEPVPQPKLLVPPPPQIKEFDPTTRQKPFQPSSTPIHLSSRFMVWNNVGIVTQYDTDEEQSISIEFHDTATHHSLHVPNVHNLSMADLSSEAAVFASPSEEDNPSKLLCMHFASWDDNKEWSIVVPEGEDITCLCVGDGWLAVGTDQQMIRIFSISGIQKEIFSIPGPIVSLSGHSNQMLIVYHKGVGIPGSQFLGVKLLQVTGHRRCIINGEDFPISPKSVMTWIGFTEEGTPACVDSLGIVRILNRSFCTSWVQLCNMKAHFKGKSDNYWVVSLHEKYEQIRAILCRGSKFPPTLPKPNVAVLPFKLPLCDMTTEKGAHEEAFWRVNLSNQYHEWRTSQGYEADHLSIDQKAVPQKETLMKLFALACKTDHEYRAVELCEMMPDSRTVQLAIKYASRVRRMQLAEKLTEIARNKVEEETRDDIPEVNSFSYSSNSMVSRHLKEEGPDICDNVTNVEEHEKKTEIAIDDVLTLKASKERNIIPKSLSNSQKGNKNPFKVASQNYKPSETKGTSVFDSMEKSREKNVTVIKSLDENNHKQSAVQGKLFSSSKKTGTTTEKPTPSAFHRWFEANKDKLKQTFEYSSDADLTVQAAKKFKSLPKDDQMVWQNIGSDKDDKKRKRDFEAESDCTDVLCSKAEAPKRRALSQSAGSKLAAFSFLKK